MFGRPLPAFLSALVLVGCAGGSDPAAPVTGGRPVVHAASGMQFPARVGAFRRNLMFRFDDAGLDVSASYLLDDPASPVVASVFIAPVSADATSGERQCQSEFQQRKAEIAAINPGARLIGEQDVSLPRGARNHPGKSASFEYTGVFGGSRLPLASHLFLFCDVDEKWTVKYRFTTPRATPAARTIMEFMDALEWAPSGGAGPAL